MNVFEIQVPSPDAARQNACNLHRSIRADHDWRRLPAEESSNAVLDHLAMLRPRAMRRALMTGFGNARLAHRDEVRVDDLPQSTSGNFGQEPHRIRSVNRGEPSTAVSMAPWQSP